jgi:hypothetical protein
MAFTRGLSVEEFVPGKYTAYFIYNWRVSAEGWHDEIAKIVGRKDDGGPLTSSMSVVGPLLPPDVGPAALWEGQIRGRPNPRILDNFEIIEGMPLVRPEQEVDPRTTAVWTTAFGARGGGIEEFKLTLPVVCDFAEGGAYATALVTKEQMAALSPLVNAARKEYDDTRPVGEEGVVQARALRRIRATIGDRATLAECVTRLGRVHGWVGVYEQSADAPFRVLKRAIDMRIPILLERENTLRIAFGYLRLAGRDCLVIVDPAKLPPPKIVEGKPEELKTTVAMAFLDAFGIETFVPGRYVAHFLHSWHIGADAYKDQILEIMARTTPAKEENR